MAENSSSHSGSSWWPAGARCLACIEPASAATASAPTLPSSLSNGSRHRCPQARLTALIDSLPGAVTAPEPKAEPRTVTQSALVGMVDAIMTSAAKRLDVPAASPEPRSRAEMAEAFLAYLDGTRFVGSATHGSDLARRIELWSRPVTAAAHQSLMVRLDEPDDAGAWHLEVLPATRRRDRAGRGGDGERRQLSPNRSARPAHPAGAAPARC